MALNAATDQQYHLLDQDGTADDQMDQLQGDHDTGCPDHGSEKARYEENDQWAGGALETINYGTVEHH
ncbi:hypothetical protein MRX96_034493 [Rhipicephalus microplus]